MKWWGIVINCGNCKDNLAVRDAGFSADGELSFTGFCEKCSTAWTWKVYATKLSWMAGENDRQARWNERNRPKPALPERRPLKPPLQIAPPLLTEEDKWFEKAIGIDPDA